MEIRQPSAASHEEACQRVASLFQRPWLRRYVAGKLRSDVVYSAAWEVLGNSRAPILDLGCGVGLLPFYFRERGFREPIIGLDMDSRKIREARAVSRGRYAGLEFLEQDVMNPLPAFHGNVAMFDVLHYLPPARQRTLLSEAASLVSPGAALLLRDCPRDGSPRFWMTYAGELFAQAVSWNIGIPLHFATRESINSPFAEEDFVREEQPASGGLPFNNRLFIFRRRSDTPGA